jgi:hypothetical protein
MAALFAAFTVTHAIRARGHRAAPASSNRRPAPEPLAAGDQDHDGLSDALEATLAERFAPVVILHPDELNRPASIPWLLSHFGPPSAAHDGLPIGLRPGSPDQRDWVTYVHVYPRVDGDINIQYWFFYAFNQSAPFFDHDTDWEHITVQVTPRGTPLGVFFAQHRNSSPGVFLSWSEVRRDGQHPIVLSARGTHASYPDQDSVQWLDSVSQCPQVDGCRDPIWRTGEAGGLVNVGEHGALLGGGGVREALAFAGRWGGRGHFPDSRPAPYGPNHQSGFAVDGYR